MVSRSTLIPQLVVDSESCKLSAQNLLITLRAHTQLSECSTLLIQTHFRFRFRCSTERLFVSSQLVSWSIQLPLSILYQSPSRFLTLLTTSVRFRKSKVCDAESLVPDDKERQTSRSPADILDRVMVLYILSTNIVNQLLSTLIYTSYIQYIYI